MLFKLKSNKMTAMEKNEGQGKWFLEFSMEIKDSDALGEPTEHTKEVKIELFALNEEEALKQAEYNIKDLKEMGQTDLKKYDNDITDEAYVHFDGFKIVYIKNLKIKIEDLSFM